LSKIFLFLINILAKKDLKQSIAGINHKYRGFLLIFIAKSQNFPLTLEDFSENSSFLMKTQ